MPYKQVGMTNTGRVCKTCSVEKSLSEFYKCRDWYFGVCKTCCSVANSTRRRKLRCKPKRLKRKFCYACRNVRPIADFYKSCRERDGWTAQCKSCAVAEQRQRRFTYALANAARIDDILKQHSRCQSCKRLLGANKFGLALHRKNGLSRSCEQCVLAKSWKTRFGVDLQWSEIPDVPRDRCCLCGWGSPGINVDLHHLLEPRNGGSPTALSNLAPVCKNCHLLIHQGVIPKERVLESAHLYQDGIL